MKPMKPVSLGVIGMKTVGLLFSFAAGLLSTCMAVAAAGDGSTPPAGPPYKLETVQHIDRFAGSARARELLAMQGFVVTDQQFSQIFEAYLSPGGSKPLPNFITVDSARHTYHVLLEDGVRQLELNQAGLLLRFSQRLSKLAATRPAQPPEVYRDLALFGAVGLALQDPAAVEQFPAEQRAVVQSVLTAIEAGGLPKPGILFFGLPLVPEQFRPVSFYAWSPELSRYYAARQWYATRVFRLEADAETLRALHLALLVKSDAPLERLYRRLTEPYEALVGPADDLALPQYLEALTEVAGGLPAAEKLAGLLSVFRPVAARLSGPRVNDQWLTREEYKTWEGRTRGMRVLPPRRLPSAVLFQNTTDPAVRNRMFPSGLDVFAAGPLACAAGRSALRRAEPDSATAEAVLRTDGGPLPPSLHGDAMQLLRGLQVPLPASAPAALRTPPWHDKQLATALAAWAEERHTFALQAKMTMSWGCMEEEPAGYVSPYPDFYRGLSKLARRAAGLLSQATPEGPDLAAAGRAWLALARKLAEMPADNRVFTVEEREEQDHYGNVIEKYFEKLGRDRHSANAPERAKAAAALEAAAKRCIAGTGVSEADRRLMTTFAKAPEGEAVELLPEFADLCDRLATMAQKELDGQALDRHDVRFIQAYGRSLARFHFYGGNSYLTPRDDFPLVAPVFSSPYGNRGEILYTGVARPEALYVILDHGGRPVLYRGAVLSYREFHRPIHEPWDDSAWGQEVCTGRAPPPPPFTASFRQAPSEQELAALIRAGQSYPSVGLMPGREITRAMIEALARPAAEQAEWLRKHLPTRVTNDDLPALLKALAEAQSCEVGELALCLARMRQLDWKQHRDKLTALVAHTTAERADAAAYLLGCYPESIDVAALADAYQRQPQRTRRLYLYLVGKSKKPGPWGEQLLRTALDDPQAAIRYQAAAALAVCGARSPAIVARLTAGIDDQNQYTAAAMVRALTVLGVKEAGAKMLARLQGNLLPPDDDNPDDARQDRELTRGTTYGGETTTQVLSCCQRRRHDDGYDDGGLGSLAEELLKGVSTLKYTPARAELHKLVHSNVSMDKAHDLGAEALEALLKLQAEKKKELLLEIIGDMQANPRALVKAVRRIRESRDPMFIEALLPLAEVPGPDDRDADFTREAYETITELLEQVDRSRPAGAQLFAKLRERILRQIRGPNSAEALGVLLQVDHDLALREALTVALDKRASMEIRPNAVRLLRNTRDPSYVEKLLPLLAEEAATAGLPSEDLSDEAATTITEICQTLDPQTPGHAAALRLARTALQKMLRGPHGPAAVKALFQLDRDERRQADCMLQTAGDRSLTYATRYRTLELLAEVEDLSWVKKLLPLLDDPTRSAEGGREEGLSIGEQAANAIAAALGREMPLRPDTSAAARADILRKVRAWAKDE